MKSRICRSPNQGRWKPSNFWSPRHTSTSASATNWGQVRYLRQAKSEDWSNGLSFRFRRKSPSPSINDLTHPNSSNTQHTYVGGFVAFGIQQARRRSISVISLVHNEKECRIKISFASQASGTLFQSPFPEWANQPQISAPKSAPLVFCIRRSSLGSQRILVFGHRHYSLMNFDHCKIFILAISVPYWSMGFNEPWLREFRESASAN